MKMMKIVMAMIIMDHDHGHDHPCLSDTAQMTVSTSPLEATSNHGGRKIHVPNGCPPLPLSQHATQKKHGAIFGSEMIVMPHSFFQRVPKSKFGN